MLFSAAKFNAHLSGPLGQSFAWRKRSACPCLTAGSGQARVGCPLCKGKGHLWAAEVLAKAGMPSQSPAKASAMFGAWEPGDAVLSIPASSPMYKIGYYDRVRSINSTNPFSIVIQPELNDALIGTVIAITRVFWLNPAGDTIVEGGIPAVADDGSLTWSSAAPPADTPYTIEGTRYDEWFVPHFQAVDRNAGVPNLPRRLPCRRLDLLSR